MTSIEIFKKLTESMNMSESPTDILWRFALLLDALQMRGIISDYEVMDILGG